MNNGTASVADLLTDVRPPLKGTVDQLNRLVTNMDLQKDRLDTALQKAPENYRKLIRTGSYGSFFNYYICELKWRVTDLQGRTAEFPWIKQRRREVRRALMLKYRGNKLIRTGFMGVVLAILIVLIGLSPETLTSMATAIRYQAQFSDAGGLTAGNDVTIAGIKVGSVSDVSLQGRNALVTFAVDGTVDARVGHHRTRANRNTSR